MTTQTPKFCPVARVTVPPPHSGIYRDISAEDYHSWDAANATTLGHFVRSGMHGEYYMNLSQDDDPPTADMLYGTAMHTAYLEPERYAETAYTPMTEPPKPTKAKPNPEEGFEPKPLLADKCHWPTHKAAQDAHPGKLILHAGWAERIETMKQRLDAHPRANALFNEIEGENELTLVWRLKVKYKGEVVEVACKARIDRYLPSFTPTPDHAKPVSGIVDLKTAGSIDPHKFERSIWDWGYHRQAAWYLLGAMEHGLIPRELHDFSYQIAAVEKSPPYPVTVFPLAPAAIQQGVSECRRAIVAYLRYRLSGQAPGPCDTYQPATLPTYAMSTETERSSI